MRHVEPFHQRELVEGFGVVVDGVVHLDGVVGLGRVNSIEHHAEFRATWSR